MIKKIAQTINEANLVLNESHLPWRKGLSTLRGPLSAVDDHIAWMQRSHINSQWKPLPFQRLRFAGRVFSSSALPLMLVSELIAAQPAAAKQRVETEVQLAKDLGGTPQDYASASRFGSKL